MYAQQWDYFEVRAGMNLPAAWDLSTGSGVVVAVLDTGYRPHADLADNLLAGYDFVNNSAMGNDGDGRDADASDPGDGCSSGHSSWHGTHVAGTIAALANNGLGIAGVAYNAKVQSVRVLGCGGGYNSDIADGMIWAAGGSVSGVPANATPAKVLNLSLGGQSACSITVQNAINTARGLGASVVVAAGNSKMAVGNFSPANCKGVITVAALGRTGARAPYSNFGPQVAVAAPGGNMNAGTANGILSTLNTGGASPGEDSYAYYQGTSMATPHVGRRGGADAGPQPDAEPRRGGRAAAQQHPRLPCGLQRLRHRHGGRGQGGPSGLPHQRRGHGSFRGRVERYRRHGTAHRNGVDQGPRQHGQHHRRGCLQAQRRGRRHLVWPLVAEPGV